MDHEPTYFEIFLTKLAFRLYDKSVYKAFADCIPLKGDEEVLDFGCGLGTVAYYVAKRLTNGRLSCLDISRRWLDVCRKTLKDYDNITYLQAEAPKLPENSFDTVYCHFVLHDIPKADLETLFPALIKSIKPDGVFVFCEPLKEAEKLKIIKRMAEHSGLRLKNSRITDVPLMGNSLISIYVKETHQKYHHYEVR